MSAAQVRRNARIGAVDLVEATGPAVIITPLGLLFPLSLLISAVILENAGLVADAGVLWPVAHVANIAPLAIS